MNEEQWFEEVEPKETEAKKRWDEDFDRPVAQCALEERIWEEQAAKEATSAKIQADDEDGS
jgi:hypothetical protein